VDVDTAKRAAGTAAAALVDDGARVGLGTGSTSRWFVLALAQRVRSGLRVTGVATSEETAQLAIEEGIPLGELDGGGLDVAVDGADAVDDDLRLIKGAGGALVREKIVAAAAARFVVVVDDTKLHGHLAGVIPVEVIPFGSEHTLRLLAATGAEFAFRQRNGRPAMSDNGNLLAEGMFGRIEDPEGLAARLDAIPGVVGHGLFLGMADLVVVGRADGSVEQRSPAAPGDRVAAGG